MTKKNDLTPSLKDIREILNQAKFNPKEPGPLNVVAHSSGPSYLESRAIEFIMEAQVWRGNIPLNQKETSEQEQYKHKMIRAIQCLSLAIVKMEKGEF